MSTAVVSKRLAEGLMNLLAERRAEVKCALESWRFVAVEAGAAREREAAATGEHARMSDKSTGDTFGDDLQARARRQFDAPRPRPRLLRADRRQMLLQPTHLDDLIPEDHRARLVWAFVESLDLGAFLDSVESVEGRAGRPAIDPAVLITMWLYATSVGVGSAREIARLIREHDAYRWIAGGLEISHRTLSGSRGLAASLTTAPEVPVTSAPGEHVPRGR